MPDDAMNRAMRDGANRGRFVTTTPMSPESRLMRAILRGEPLDDEQAEQDEQPPEDEHDPIPDTNGGEGRNRRDPFPRQTDMNKLLHDEFFRGHDAW